MLDVSIHQIYEPFLRIGVEKKSISRHELTSSKVIQFWKRICSSQKIYARIVEQINMTGKTLTPIDSPKSEKKAPSTLTSSIDAGTAIPFSLLVIISPTLANCKVASGNL